MTAPLTPPHQPSDNPWQTPLSGSGSHPVPPAQEPLYGDGVLTVLRQAAAVAGLLTVAGIALGLLWLWLAPRVPLISDATAVFLKDSEGEQAIGADGTFVLLALAFGAVAALVVFLFRRRGGVGLVVGLAIGGLLGSLVAWRFGIWFGGGSDVVARAKAAGKGVTFDAPIKLNAKAAMLAWPIASMLMHLALTALFTPRTPEPAWAPPYKQDEP